MRARESGSTRLFAFAIMCWALAAALTCVLPAAASTSSYRVGYGPAAGSQVYWVAPWGSDSGPGTPAEPYRTIQWAIDIAAATDTICLLDGTYRGSGNRDLDFNGKNLVLKSASDDPTACVIDCEGTAGDPHYGIWLHSDEDTTSVLRGFTITNAYVEEPAFAALMGGNGPFMGSDPTYVGATAYVVNCRIVDNYGTGVGSIYTSETWHWQDPQYSFNIADCEISRNQGNGLFMDGNSTVLSPIVRSVVSDNAGNGVDAVSFGGDAVRLTISESEFCRNGGHGISMWSPFFNIVDVSTSIVADNDGWGVYAHDAVLLGETSVSRNGSGGVYVNGIVDGTFLDVSGGEISGNLGFGISFVGDGGRVSLTGLTLVENTGGGIEVINDISAVIPDIAVFIGGSTIAHNGGCGINYFCVDAASLSVENCIIAENLGGSLCPEAGSAVPVLSCCDVYGNTGGDWSGSLAAMATINGNFSLPPQFCEPSAGDYHLATSSLCAEENNGGCGRIGVLGTGCGSRLDTCADIQDYDPATGAITSTRINEQVTVQGVVYVAPATYSGVSGGYLQDATGGINFWSYPPAIQLREGDLVQLAGPLWYDSGELYAGAFTYALVDSNQVPTPAELTVSELLSDYDHVGMFVHIPGTVSQVEADSVWISDGTDEVKVLFTPYVGLSTAAIHVGMNGWVQGPCTVINGEMSVKPRRPGDVGLQGGAWEDVVAGDLIDPTPGSGVAWSDLDRDGLEDIVIVRSNASPRIMRNNGASGFTDITPACASEAVGPGLSIGDANADRWLDIFVSNAGGIAQVIEGDGTGGFMCADLGGVTNHPTFPYPGTWVDYNLDGVLDLVVANYDDTGNGAGLEMYDGAAEFALSTPASLQLNGRFQAMQWVDLDLDGDLDLLLTTEDTPATAYENRGDSFAPHVFGTRPGCQGIDAGDYNNDGLLDIYVSHWGNIDELFLNAGNWQFEIQNAAGIQGGFSQSCLWGDYDNDGLLDIFVTRYNLVDVLYRNNGDMTFTAITDPFLGGPESSIGGAHADYDNDGDLDLYVANAAGQDALYRNGYAPAGNNWLELRLVDGDGRVNTTAIGARAVAFAGGRKMTRVVAGGNGYNSQNSNTVHFGLGEATVVDSLVIYWPTIVAGTPRQIERNLPVNTKLSLALSAPVGVPSAVISDVVLHNAVPNPFNPMTTIAFDLPRPGRIQLRIYDMSGRLVRTVAAEDVGAGHHAYQWTGVDDNGRSVSAGVYFYRLEAEGATHAKRMTLLK